MVHASTCFPAPVAVVNLLHLAPHTFYPTGSRYLGGARPDSDWDFVGPATLEVEAWLLQLGFKDMDLKGNYIGTDATRKMLNHVSPEGEVQVQLADDPAAKHAAADWIRDNLFELHLELDHKERGRLWTELYWAFAASPSSRAATLKAIKEGYLREFGWRLTWLGKKFYKARYILMEYGR